MLERAVERASSSTSDSPPAGPIERGIVIAAGGPLYFACAFVCVWVLRRLGCTLPVEFWHLGWREIDDDRAALVKPLGVTCRDALEITPSPRRLTGWELKPFSVIHSRYDEVLFLDADNVPVIDPAYLFDEPEYRKRGAVFWPDPPPSFIPQLTWDVAGVRDRGRMPFESGQFLIDKRRCRAELLVAMHLNEHSDFWYQYVYGDKDTFKLAWHKMNSCYAMPTKSALWLPPAIHQYDFTGRPLFTHVCRGKEKLLAGEPIRTLPQCDFATQAAAALRQLQSASQHRLPA